MTVDLLGTGAPGEILHDGQLTIGGITLGVTDAYGVDWVLEKLAGWSDSEGSTGTTEQRPAAHGAWLSPAYYTARVVEITGSLFANTWDGAEAAVDRLMAAIPLNLPTTMSVATNARTLQADVRQDGDPLVEILDGCARFSLSLIAADPRRYSSNLISLSTGLPQTSGGLTLPITLPITINATVAAGMVQAYNAGNIATLPTMAINGPCPPSTITHIATGKRLFIPEAVAAGRSLILDFDSRTALLDGTAARVVTGLWFDLPPGDNDIAFSASSYDAGALLTINYRSAWR